MFEVEFESEVLFYDYDETGIHEEVSEVIEVIGHCKTEKEAILAILDDIASRNTDIYSDELEENCIINERFIKYVTQNYKPGERAYIESEHGRYYIHKW